MVNMLVSGSLMTALVGGVTLTLMTSKAILFVHKTEEHSKQLMKTVLLYTASN